MIKCDKCNKEFETKQSLVGHRSIHREGPRYSVSRKKNKQKYKCKYCNVEFEHKVNSTNLFCSTSCFGKHKKLETKLKVDNKQQVSECTLRRFVFETFENKCALCGLGCEWNNKQLALQMDHIDGNSDNNVLENVRILCPNCHSQTANFGSKGFGNKKKKQTKRNKYLQDYKNGSLV